jgi:DNA-binding response OmpR family regulator
MRAPGVGAGRRETPVIRARRGRRKDTRKALAAGCDGFDTEPIDLERLLAKIRAVLGRR